MATFAELLHDPEVEVGAWGPGGLGGWVGGFVAGWVAVWVGGWMG